MRHERRMEEEPRFGSLIGVGPRAWCVLAALGTLTWLGRHLGWGTGTVCMLGLVGMALTLAVHFYADVPSRRAKMKRDRESV